MLRHMRSFPLWAGIRRRATLGQTFFRIADAAKRARGSLRLAPAAASRAARATSAVAGPRQASTAQTRLISTMVRFLRPCRRPRTYTTRHARAPRPADGRILPMSRPDSTPVSTSPWIWRNLASMSARVMRSAVGRRARRGGHCRSSFSHSVALRSVQTMAAPITRTTNTIRYGTQDQSPVKVSPVSVCNRRSRTRDLRLGTRRREQREAPLDTNVLQTPHIRAPDRCPHAVVAGADLRTSGPLPGHADIRR